MTDPLAVPASMLRVSDFEDDDPPARAVTDPLAALRAEVERLRDEAANAIRRGSEVRESLNGNRMPSRAEIRAYDRCLDLIDKQQEGS